MLDFERKRSDRSGQPLALVMIDIDRFKDFNDAHGHIAGDQCLQQVSKAISDAVRGSGDLVARYGGEEFGVILPGTGLEGGAVLAERVRQKIESLSIPLGPGSSSVVTISLGVAATARGAEGLDSALVAAADEALYRAKQNGRNRVELAESRESQAAAQ